MVSFVHVAKQIFVIKGIWHQKSIPANCLFLNFYLWTCYCNVRLGSILFGLGQICFVFNVQCMYSYNEVPLWYWLLHLMSYIWDHKVLTMIWLISLLLLLMQQWMCHCCLCLAFLLFWIEFWCIKPYPPLSVDQLACSCDYYLYRLGISLICGTGGRPMENWALCYAGVTRGH